MSGPAVLPDRAVRRDWLIAAGLSAAPLVAVGVARFAYALLLPPMRTELHWSYAQAGSMNTANAVGYLIGAVAAGPLLPRIGVRRGLVAALLLTTLGLLGCAVTERFEVLLALRLLAGAAGAVAFVAGAGLTAHAGARLPAARAAVLIALYVAGGGWGIALSGLAVPPLIDRLDPATGWRVGWLMLGLIGALATLPAALASRRVPPLAPEQAPRAGRWPRRRLTATLASYLLFGAGYIAYATFVVALLKTERVTDSRVSVFWVLLGTAAGLGFCWGPLLGRTRGARGLAILLAVLAVGAVLPLHAVGPLALYSSAVLFGGCVLSTASAVTVIARRTLPARFWHTAIAELTALFAIGQCVGPVLAGALSDRTGGVRAGLLLSGGLLALAAVIALIQPDHSAPSAEPRGSSSNPR